MTREPSVFKPPPKGLALILFAMVIILGTTAMMVSSRSVNMVRLKRAQSSLEALAKAKDALIAFAVSAPLPGSLPCPDRDNDGRQDGAGNNCLVDIGWLPFRDLGLDDLRDGSGERIWYGVSPNFHVNTPNQLNSDTETDLTLDDQTDIVAAVFAPGPALEGQVGRFENDLSGGGNANQVGRYLEQTNALNNTTNYISSDPDVTDSDPFNDVVLGIRPQELLPPVEQRVVADLVNVLIDFRDNCASGALPFAAPFGAADAQPGLRQGGFPTDIWGGTCPDLPGWFVARGWQNKVYYSFCTDGPSGSPECIEYCRNTATCTSGTPANAILVMAGRELSGQSRSVNPANTVHFFENENQDEDNVFVQNNPLRSYLTHNDILKVFDHTPIFQDSSNNPPYNNNNNNGNNGKAKGKGKGKAKGKDKGKGKGN